MTTFAVLSTWIESLEDPDAPRAEVIESMKEWRRLHAGERLPTAVYVDALRDSLRRWIHVVLICRNFARQISTTTAQVIDDVLSECQELLAILDLYIIVLDWTKTELRPSAN